VSARYSFQLSSSDPRRRLPHKLLLSCDHPDTATEVLLKLLGYLLFDRQQLQIEPNLHNDNIPYRPGLVQLDYELRPVLWIECGDCSVEKLDRLAVKVPEAELWVLKPTLEEAEALLRAMARARLRKQRYRVIGFEADLIRELLEILGPRNQVFWVRGSLDPAALQFEFNNLWFDHSFTLLQH
jgi:hypothetical protein